MDRERTITLVCERCEKKYKVFGYLKNRSRFCSISCSSKSQIKGVRGIQTLRKGTKAYSAAHYKLRTQRSKKYKCTVCLKQTKKTEWAYLDGDPFNVDNYIEFCQQCHYRFDRRRVAVIGVCK